MTERMKRLITGLWRRRSIVAFAHDIVIAALAPLLAYYLRVGADIIDPKYSDILMLSVPLYAMCAAAIFWFVGLYRGFWRYASIPDLVNITKAAFLSIAIFLPILFVINRLEGMPRTVPIIQFMIVVGFLGGSRFIYRVLWRRYVAEDLNDENNGRSVPVLLYGAGDAAELFIRAAQKGPSNYRPVGIIDDRASRRGRSIHGVPVLGKSRDLNKIMNKLKQGKAVPQRLILTTRGGMKSDGPVIRALNERAQKHGLTLARLPEMNNVRQMGDERVLDLRPVAIEDLLGRPQQVMNKDDIAAMIKGRRILVTGAGGSIGSEICNQILGFEPKSLAMIDHAEHNLYQIEMNLRDVHPEIHRSAALCDIRDRVRLSQIFKMFHPDIVFHAAAYKHVPIVEANPSEGILTNAIGTRNVADLCKVEGVDAMVQISTDKAVNPTNVMGATKKVAEYYCQALDLDQKSDTRYLTVRFGNVLGSSGSVIPLFEKQLKEGGPLTVTDPEIERFFMTIPEAVGLVLSASAYGLNESDENGHIFVLDMGEPVKIDEIARQMIRLSGLEPDRDIKIIYTGLRPGEKMYEELFNSGENMINTDLAGIQAARPDPIPRPVLRKALTELEEAAKQNDTARIMQTLKQLVPGYVRSRETAAA